MAKKNDVTAFDELLEAFSEEGDRKVFEDLASRYPQVREYGMRQSDYSRKLNEVKQDIEELQEWRGWREQHWDDSRNMTKAEIAKAEKLAQLEQEKEELENRLTLGLGGEDVTFEQLEGFGKKWIEDNELLTREQLKAKEDEMKNLVTGVNRFSTTASLTIPYLNQKHKEEFGEFFKPGDFWQEAVKRNCYEVEQLEGFYTEWTAGKRSEREKTQHEQRVKELQDSVEAEKAKAREEGKKEAARTSAAGLSPVDTEGPTMGAFQEKYLGLKKEDAGDGAPQVDIGEGGIAAYAARKFREQQANRA